jgi:hypothetical protein
METIGKILLNYETDKNLGVVTKGHYYGETYDKIFETFDRNGKLNILEIGVQKGASLQAWKDYFQNSNVYGIDIEDTRLEKYKKENLIFILSDVKNPELKNNPLIKDLYFDIIIDDGSHLVEDVLHVVRNFVGLLNVNGYLIIEDVWLPELLFNEVLKIVNTSTFEVTPVDLRNINGQPDDYLLLIRRIS